MAMLTAVTLRDAIRDEGIRLGLRGFVRFAPEGGPLFVTDMLLRADEAGRTAFIRAAEELGCVCIAYGPLTGISPGDKLLETICREMEETFLIQDDARFSDELALAERWIAVPQDTPDSAGRQLMLDTMRLAMVSPERLNDALWPLRRKGAEMQATNHTAGMHESGIILKGLILGRSTI